MFIGSGALGALAIPRVSTGQSARKIARIGIMSFAGTAADLVGPEPTRPSVKALILALRELGYVYGRDFVTEARGGEGRPELAPGPVLATIKQSTSTIPVVMAAASEPLIEGYVRSLARPGGNFTGLSLQEIDHHGERLELKELVPSPAPVAILWNNWRAESIRYWQAPSRRHGNGDGRSSSSRSATRASWREPSRRRQMRARAGSSYAPSRRHRSLTPDEVDVGDTGALAVNRVHRGWAIVRRWRR